MIYLKGINHKNHVQYPDVPSAIRPIPHGSELPVSEPDCNMEYSSDSKNSVVSGDDTYNPEEDERSIPLAQAELNDLT